jgi:hypothetical protein
LGEELSNFLYDNREEIVREKIVHKAPVGGSGGEKYSDSDI